jgi:hypothetical protein
VIGLAKMRLDVRRWLMACVSADDIPITVAVIAMAHGANKAAIPPVSFSLDATRAAEGGGGE